MSSPTPAQQERVSLREQGRVLIVTDNPSTITFAQALEDAGLAIVGTSKSVAALIAMRRARPDIIIADECLHGLTTRELASQLQCAEETAIPFMLVGARDPTLERRRAALEAGAFDYFQIPTELPLLVARATQLVSVRQSLD
ncbi:MAG: response regulator, partial [Acidobacteria bacterium]|nr:response regulator [Acidobacteriota bacterium]